MRQWLPVLVESLAQSPILALAGPGPLATAAVYDAEGWLLAGNLGSPCLAETASRELRELKPGEGRQTDGPASVRLQRLDGSDPQTRLFWESAATNSQDAWASWLLSIPASGQETNKAGFTQHLLSAFGPWTRPRLPQELEEQWLLTPLKPGLGRLFVIGGDALALETSALAARAGLTVTWLSVDPPAAEDFDEARRLGEFSLLRLDSWEELTPDFLHSQGFRRGVKVLVTAPQPELFIDSLKETQPSYLALAGEAEKAAEKAAGLFSQPFTTSHRALGLIAEMLI